jgi:hypothetical protein
MGRIGLEYSFNRNEIKARRDCARLQRRFYALLALWAVLMVVAGCLVVCRW